jgi:hypothetical protein
MMPDNKSMAFQNSAQKIYSVSVATSEKHDFVSRVLAMDCDDALSSTHQSQTGRLVKPRTGDVQFPVVAALDAFKNVERHVVTGDRLGNL